MAVASVKTNDNVELMGIPRDDWADTWHGHNTNWANESFSGAGQRLISSCCVLLHANRLHRQNNGHPERDGFPSMTPS